MEVENLKQIHQEYQWYLQHEKRLTYETCQLYKTISEQFLQYVKNNIEKLYLENNWTLNDLTGRTVQVFLIIIRIKENGRTQHTHPMKNHSVHSSATYMP